MKPIHNEEFVAKYRDWRLQWKPTEDQIKQEIKYISKLADFKCRCL